ncbi:hypothetical protein D3C77_381680 [compost metagenome]
MLWVTLELIAGKTIGYRAAFEFKGMFRMIFSHSGSRSTEKRRVLKAISLIFCSSILSTSLAQAASAPEGPTFEQVSRCVYVFQPMLEVAKSTSNKPLQDYILPRVTWLMGYMQAKKGDATFKLAFYDNLPANKLVGEDVEKRLRAALNASSEDREAALTSALQPSRECDKYIGMSI